jgi:tRNA(Ile)-lysidine synthase
MLENISHILQHICFLDRDKPIVVGVSGGPDSLCLFDLLRRCEYKSIVAHLNHGLRQTADEEEQRLKSTVSMLGIPYVSQKIDVKNFARENRMSIEEGAREARYRFLFEQAKVLHAQAVVVGHNANDQVETVLMHLLRGAGLAGLRGMELRLCPNAWSDEIPLIRPLLNFWREDILAYLSDRGLFFETDESNIDTSYYRNRMRYELIPYLAGYNPEISRAILRTSELLRAEYAVIENAVQAASRECSFRQEAGYVAMSASAWKSQPIAIQRSLLRKAVAGLNPGLRDLDYAAIERAVIFLNSHSTGKCDLTAGITLSLEREDIFLLLGGAELPADDWPQIQEGMVFELEIPGECRFRNGWVLKSYLVVDLERIFRIVVENEDLYRVWMDLDQLSVPLIIRPRLPGDRIQVLGMGGQSTKLSDLMINAKLPQRVRQSWPVVVSGKYVAWAPGLRMNERYRVVPETLRAACLELTRDEPT